MTAKQPNPGSDPQARERQLIAAAQRDLSKWAADRIPIASPEDAAIAPPELAEDSFPGYRLHGEIHRGGQGVVYRATHIGTKREVAIKVLREGPFAGRQDITRFAREAQVLAQLRHPHIVTIHDSGVAAGRFYIVMDFIAGLPLDQFVAEHKPSLEHTLRLFLKVCEAVNAAQLKGVIHRDLKPGNILVDAAGEPHVLDFGLAKLQVGENEVAVRAMSLTGQFIGSLPWASPEQAEGAPAKIDLRTDVYALGVVLYQMLTGRFPYDVIGNMRDVLDNILRAEPARPSTIRRRINDEVETIVLKCLSKERERRYQSAGELARDIGRYLSGEPIEAKRDSAMYIMGKWARRNRIKAAVLALLAVAFSGSYVALSVSRHRLADAVAIKTRSEYLNAIALAQYDHQSRNLGRMKQRLAACPPSLRGWEWSFLSALADRSSLSISSGFDAVYAMEVSPHAGLIAAGGAGDEVRLLDAATGALRCVLQLPRAAAAPGEVAEPGLAGALHVTALSFDPAGVRLLGGSSEGVVAAWDVRTQAVLWHVAHHEGAVRCVDFAPTGAGVAAGWDGSAVRILDAGDGHEALVYRGHEHPVLAVRFSPDGARVASAGIGAMLHGDGVKIWDAQTGELVVQITGLYSLVGALEFSPDGRRLATGEDDGSIRQWDAASGTPLADPVDHGGSVTSLDFSGDGRSILSGGRDSTIRLGEVDDAVPDFSIPAMAGRVAAVRFLTRDSFAAAGEDRDIRIWQTAACPEPLTLTSPLFGVWSMAFTADGRFLAAGGPDAHAVVYDVIAGRLAGRLAGHAVHVYTLAFSPDGRSLATGDHEGMLRLWDWSSDKCLAEWKAHEGSVSATAFSPDGSSLATGGADGAIVLWNTGGHTATSRFPLDEPRITSLSFGPDGRRLIAAGSSGRVRVLDVQAGTTLAELDAQAAGGCTAVLSPNGGSVAITGIGRLVLWDLPEAARGAAPNHAPPAGRTRALRTQGGEYTRAAYSPDGSRVAVLEANTMTLFDTVDAEATLTLKVHDGDATAVAFSPDGRCLATGGMDASICIRELSVPPEAYALRAAGREAEARVAGLFRRFGFEEDVIQALESDPGLTPETLAAARQSAELHGDDPHGLQHLAWETVSAADADEEAYRTAFRRAERACELIPTSPVMRRTLGVALFRLGRNDDALPLLRESLENETAAGEGRATPATLAFLTMSLRRAGHAREAEARMAELAAIVRQAGHAPDPEVARLLAEARPPGRDGSHAGDDTQ